MQLSPKAASLFTMFASAALRKWLELTYNLRTRAEALQL